jgi:predicted metalloprotease with PDZ domain
MSRFMKKQVFAFLLSALIPGSCSSSKSTATSGKNEVRVSLDLMNVMDDKVKVVAKPTPVKGATVTYQLPKVIPGTYAVADYGKYVVDFRALDKSGNPLPVTRTDMNTWAIANAELLASVEYWVNDTFDQEQADAADPKNNIVFSPAGTNILKGENFYLNLCGFVGYFGGHVDYPYTVVIDHPQELTGTTAMVDIDNSATRDVFQVERYAEVVDNPVMYAKPDISRFNIGGMEVFLHVYSPSNKQVTASFLQPELQKTMTAQKAFLGDINQNKKYAVLVYLSDLSKDNAQGLGALEHNSSTSSTFGDEMEADGLNHTISHEFFHILTPLNVHSKEIHDFDFNNPKMSQHLWMYEGFTEYFSCRFKVNKGLGTEQGFYDVIMDKFKLATNYREDISITEMSKNVLDPEINKQFGNAYNKGAGIAMCLDIIIREKSNGKRGILSVMGELAKIYGPKRPFNDDELIPKFTELTYPEVGDFLRRNVAGKEPIGYAAYLRRVGVATETVQLPVTIALTVGGKNYFHTDPQTNKVYIDVLDGKNEFVRSMGFQDQDELVEVNGVRIEGPNAAKYTAILGYKKKDGDAMSAKVLRKGQPVDLKANITVNKEDGQQLRFRDESKKALKEAWLRG